MFALSWLGHCVDAKLRVSIGFRGDQGKKKDILCVVESDVSRSMWLRGVNADTVVL